KGLSTLGGRKIWFDDAVFRLNGDGRGICLGEFAGDDKILVITKNGYFRNTGFDLSNHFEDNILIIEKFRPGKVYSAIYYDGELKYHYIKRFMIEESEKPLLFISEHPDSRLISLTEVEYPRFEISFGGKHRNRENEIIEVAEFIGVKSHRAKGRRLTNYMVDNVLEIEPVVRKEGVQECGQDEEEDDQAGLPAIVQDHPAQMKLEL
ncbi:MAG TPA: DNA gyrase/topoisomerase IV subunit A, partial [Bacteroidales bacterium]|nr:DNA gyrase/topoisomerase IV subunit A [Bacteroidales bacterium]